MSAHGTYPAMAALSICEAQLLALNDDKVPQREIAGILQDVAGSRENGATEAEVEMHTAVATLINRIIAGGTSVRTS